MQPRNGKLANNNTKVLQIHSEPPLFKYKHVMKRVWLVAIHFQLFLLPRLLILTWYLNNCNYNITVVVLLVVNKKKKKICVGLLLLCWRFRHETTVACLVYLTQCIMLYYVCECVMTIFFFLHRHRI